MRSRALPFTALLLAYAQRTLCPAAAAAASFGARAAVACRLAAAPRRASHRAARGVCEARRGGGDDAPTVPERLVASIPYVLPLLDGLRYSAWLLQRTAALWRGAPACNALAQP